MYKSICLSLAFMAIIGPTAAQSGPNALLFEELYEAPDAATGQQVAADIWAGWLESGSPSVDLLMRRALLADQAGRKDMARALLDRVIRLEPDYGEGWHRRALMFLRDEKIEQALRDINETLRCEPRHFAAWAEMGYILERMGSTSEAIEAYAEALAIYPHMPEAKTAHTRLTTVERGFGL